MNGLAPVGRRLAREPAPAQRCGRGVERQRPHVGVAGGGVDEDLVPEHAPVGDEARLTARREGFAREVDRHRLRPPGGDAYLPDRLSEPARVPDLERGRAHPLPRPSGPPPPPDGSATWRLAGDAVRLRGRRERVHPPFCEGVSGLDAAREKLFAARDPRRLSFTR